MKRDHLGGIILGEGRRFSPDEQRAQGEFLRDLAREDRANAEAYT